MTVFWSPAARDAGSGTPSTVHTMSANAAAAAHQHASRFVDARQPNLYALERVSGAISYPGPPAPCPELPQGVTSFIVYDSGSTSRIQPFSRAAAVMDAMLARWPCNMRFILLIGGLPAIKELAPHLVDSSLTADSAALARMRAKLASKPAWVSQALDSLACSTAPAAQVLPWLYLGGFEDIKKPSRLKEMKISHVLVMAAELADFPFPEHLHVERIEALDSPDYNIQAHFPRATAFLDDIRQKRDQGEDVCVLVHCYAGISRSVTIVVAYLMARCFMTTTEALQLVRSRRLGASPNSGFMNQLEAWELSTQDNIPRAANSIPP